MAYVEVDGLKEFQRAVRQIRSKELNRQLGQANKRIGQMVIDRLYPNPNPLAVGAGRGAEVRASASKREVILRVGGSHRAAPFGPPKPGDPSRDEIRRMRLWGARFTGRVGQHRPDRPNIQGTAEQNFDDIAEAWLDATLDAFALAGEVSK